MPEDEFDRGICLLDELWAEIFCLLLPDVHVDNDMVEMQYVAEVPTRLHIHPADCLLKSNIIVMIKKRQTKQSRLYLLVYTFTQQTVILSAT